MYLLPGAAEGLIAHVVPLMSSGSQIAGDTFVNVLWAMQSPQRA